MMKKFLVGLALFCASCSLQNLTPEGRFHYARGTYVNLYETTVAVAESSLTPPEVDVEIVKSLDMIDLAATPLIEAGKAAVASGDTEALQRVIRALEALNTSLRSLAEEYDGQ